MCAIAFRAIKIGAKVVWMQEGIVNVTFLEQSLNDPFGWGWNLFGTASYPWTPYVPQVLPYLQVPILLGGLIISIRLAARNTKAPSR